MGPKKTENTTKSNKLLTGVGNLLNTSSSVTGTESGESFQLNIRVVRTRELPVETQQCIGKFAIDLELCCRESAPAYPVLIPVYVRGHPPVSSQIQSNRPPSQPQGRSRPHSRASITPSIAGVAEEQSAITGKRFNRPRKSSTAQSGILIEVTAIDNDSQSLSYTGLCHFFSFLSFVFYLFKNRRRNIENSLVVSNVSCDQRC